MLNLKRLKSSHISRSNTVISVAEIPKVRGIVLLRLLHLHKGSFKNHLDIILPFFDRLPNLVDIFYVLNVEKNGKF